MDYQLSNTTGGLEQGQSLNAINNSMVDSCDYSLMDKTTMENMDSINETTDKADSKQAHLVTSASKNQGELQELDNLDKQFNQILAEYTSTLKLMNEEIISQSANYSTLKDMFGKVVINNDAGKVFVNNYGVTHQYSQTSWQHRNSNCPTNPINGRENDLSKLPQGPGMGIGQPCYVAGKNVQNKKTKEVAWVDIKGRKHVYSNSSWKNKTQSCNIKPLQLNSDAYDAIPSGPNMTSKDLCFTMDIDPKVYIKLSRLNTELMKIGELMNKKMIQLSKTESNIENKMNEKQKQFRLNIQQLEKDRNKMNGFNNNYETIIGLQDDSHLIYNANYYNYLAWSLAAVTIGGITIHQISKK